MEANSREHKRKNGIYYTPHELARYLAHPLIRDKKISVFDPAYGDGALLLAAEKIFQEKSDQTQIELFGCDTNPVNGLLMHLPEANLNEMDFFDFPISNKFDIILTNPPYIRHQEQNKESVKKHKKEIEELNFLSNSSDLWAYFLVKAKMHLKSGGSIGAIVPWAFLQSDYAQELRKRLLEEFSSIKVIALNNPYFDKAQERVVLLWLEEFGSNTKSIKLAFAKDININQEFKEVSKCQWIAPKVFISGKNGVAEALTSMNKIYGFKRFSKYSDTRIGIVTGANKYFIKTNDEAARLGFRSEHLLPILTTAKELPDFLHQGSENLKKLILISKEDFDYYSDYLNKGKKNGIHQRSHCKKRKPWYSISSGRVPDAFFPYRVGTTPFLALNKSKVQSTNSVHRIYFKNLSKTEIKWIQISLLSVYGQLSLEVNSKTYGRGMLKIEPGSLANVFVLCRKDKIVAKTYNQIIKLLSIGDKEKGVRVATNFITQELKIPIIFQQRLITLLENIRRTRER